MTKVKSSRVTVELRESDRKAVEAAAKAANVTISEFVRSAIADRLEFARKRQVVAEARADAVEAAFEALDEQEGSRNVLPVPPIQNTKPPFDPTRHPCAHLRDFVPPNFRKGEIPGSCGVQGMKPCHFRGSSATACPMFVRAAYARR